MAEKKKPRGKAFKPGNQLAKGHGRPETSKEDKALSRLSRNKFNTLVRTYFHLNVAELKEKEVDPGTPMLDLMVISVMLKAVTSGDHSKVDWFLEQLFGKLKTKTEVKHSGKIESNPTVDLSTLTDKQLAQLDKMVPECQEKE